MTVIKVHDGTQWIDVLPGSGSGSSGDDLTLHLMDPTPHPVYDDMASLVLIFENQLI